MSSAAPHAASAAADGQTCPNSQQQQGQQRRRLPVTLLSGFLGAGKTTLVKHLLRNAGPLRIAVVVNDVAALNIDSSLIKGGGLIQSQEQVVELQNGCICCSLRVDLVAAVADLAARGAFDLLLLESTGVSEPMQVAEMFDVDLPISEIINSSSNSSGGPASVAAAAAATAVSAAAGGGDSAAAAVLLRDVSYLDTAVTVVDAHHMLANLHSIHTFRDLSEVDGSGHTAAAGVSESVLSGSHRHIAELLLEQIEVADVLLLNKADTVSADELQLLQAMLQALNPSAKLLTTTNSSVDPSEVLLTGLWDTHRAQGGAAWVQLMRHEAPQQQQQQQQHAQSQQQQQQHHHDCSDHGPCIHQHSHDHSGYVAHSSSSTSSSCPCCPTTGGGGEQAPSCTSAAAAAGGGALGAARPTSSYGVSHFVYRARLPFHPVRLHDFMVKFFILQEPDWSRMLGEGAPSDTGDADVSSDSEGDTPPAAVDAAADTVTAAAAAVGKGVQQVHQLQSVAAERRKALEGCFGVVLRSKGFVWLATRSDHIGEWSQAGSLLSFSTGGPWFCVQPPDAWPDGEDERAAILADFSPSVGDRRQELVFIGVGLNEQQLRAALDECLVTVGDMELGFRGLEDLFEPWPDVEDMMDLGEPFEEEVAEEEELPQQQQQQQAAAPQQASDASSAAVCWRPGHVASIGEGAAQMQELLNSIDDTLSDTATLTNLISAAAAEAEAAANRQSAERGTAGGVLQQQAQSVSAAAAAAVEEAAAAAAAAPHAVILEWVAPWASASLTLSQQLRSLATICPQLPVVSVDVCGSWANQVLSLEKVMEVPQAYRKGGRKFPPVPKSGEKWPCVTLHMAPSLQPQQEFSGPHTLDNLLQALLQLGCISQAAVDAAAAAAVAATMPAAVAAITAAAAAAAYRGPVRPPPKTAGLTAAEVGQESEGEVPAAAAADVEQSVQQQPVVAPNKQQQQQQQQQRRRPFQLVKRGAADLKQLLQQVTSSQLLLLVWSPTQPTASAAAAAAAAADVPTNTTSTSSSTSRMLIDSTDAVESLAAALVSAAAAANSSSLVVVAVADAAASAANQALATALSVQQPVVQLYHNRQVVKAVKVGGLEVGAAVNKVQKAVLQVLQQAQAAAQQPKQQQVVQQQPQQQQREKQQEASTAALAEASNAAASKANDSAIAAEQESSTSAASTSTAAAAAAGDGATTSKHDDSSSSSSIWDPPAGKPGKPAKPGTKQKFPASAVFGASSSSSSSIKAGSTVKAVYWPRMPCLDCGCPWWLGEDWDATCARCGWSCEEDGYDDDSNPLPQYAQRYKDIVAELKAGRTPTGLQPLEG